MENLMLTKSKKYKLSDFIILPGSIGNNLQKGFNKRKNELVAIKSFDIDVLFKGSSQKGLIDLRKHVEAIKSCEHENICRYICSFVDSGSTLYLVTELLKGSIRGVIDYLCFKNRVKKYKIEDEQLLIAILYQVIKALEYLHESDLMHRSINPTKLLISNDGIIKLYGFYTSRINKGFDGTFNQPVWWSSPEVLKQVEGSRVEKSADIWSVGIIAVELINGEAPHINDPPLVAYKKIIQEPAPRINNENFSKGFIDLINSCLNKKPKQRPTAKELLENKIFSKCKSGDYIREKLELDSIPEIGDRRNILRMIGLNDVLLKTPDSSIHRIHFTFPESESNLDSDESKAEIKNKKKEPQVEEIEILHSYNNNVKTDFRSELASIQKKILEKSEMNNEEIMDFFEKIFNKMKDLENRTKKLEVESTSKEDIKSKSGESNLKIQEKNSDTKI